MGKIQTGDRFGKLTVVAQSEQRKNHYVVWRCRCDCGEEILVSSRDLKRGAVTDCGCIPRSSARRGNIAEDLTGKRFGSLVVTERAGHLNGRVAWLCQCECGNTKTVTAHDLKSGKCRSCGCLRKKRGRTIVDLTGRRFGRLTVLYPTDRRDEKRSVFWMCRCDCGNTVEVTESNLVYGTYRSCGCLKREQQGRVADYMHWIDGTCVELLEKKKKRTDNTSGVQGICRMKNRKYRVDIGFKGKRYYIGTFEKLEDAVLARTEAEEKIHKGFTRAYRAWKEKSGGDPEWEEEHPLVFEVRKENGQFVIEDGRKQVLNAERN
ncbi:MAG: transcriptional regulator [Clostridiales bacterium]|nr:transcriptional regulator [Clostridiales bacterium]